ncbi:glutamate receptor ionotropic, kainate 1-like [Anastrepha obliqua]|uniref:glutamate receptor ionotropic, kainate 1-like n=1 Tax=Anastrepha obliqua TaxID=95512 RepID=UPI002409639F|nr:glutamate receptor ionotropic, kainate 1-like [Anastrepha obliqua]
MFVFYSPSNIEKLFNIATCHPHCMILVGAISSDKQNGPTDQAFQYAISRINQDKSLLPDTKFSFDLQHVAKYDSFHACQKVCTQIKSGVQAVFGPFNAILGSHIHSICDALDIPHLETRIDLDVAKTEFSINLHPTQDYVNTAFEDVIRYLNWTRAGILYERDYVKTTIEMRKYGNDLAPMKRHPLFSI